MQLTSPLRTPERKHYSDSLSRLMLTTALVGVVSISGTQAFAGDPIFIESENSVTIDNTEVIAATGPAQAAINIFSEQNVTASNSGGLSSIDGMGIAVDSAGTATVTNTGDITSNDETIQVEANGEVIINNSGHIIGGEYGSVGIQSESESNSVIVNSGKIVGRDGGIQAFGQGTIDITNTEDGVVESREMGIESGSGNKSTILNAGEIKADHIGITATVVGGSETHTDDDGESHTHNYAGGELNVTNSGAINIAPTDPYKKVSYELDGYTQVVPASLGILAVSMNGGAIVDESIYGDQEVERTEFAAAADDAADNSVSITNSGTIDGTGSDQSNGIYAMASDGINIKNTGYINTRVSAVFAVAFGDIDVTNDGDIDVTGTDFESAAIFDRAAIALKTLDRAEGEDAGNITLTNNGDIDAPNTEWGMAVESGGKATVTNTGNITAFDKGIAVEATGDATVINSGTVTSKNMTQDEHSGKGIHLIHEAAGTVINSGTLIASEVGIESDGTGSVIVTNESAGKITAFEGMVVVNGGGSTITNAGTIEAGDLGIGAITFGGTRTETNEDGEEETFSFLGGEVNITNSGSITTSENDTIVDTRVELDGYTLPVPTNIGIWAVSMNGGTIVGVEYDENGEPYDDRFDVTPAADNVANNAVAITNSGTIDGTGSDQSNGIYAMASDGINIKNTGDINTRISAVFAVAGGDIDAVNDGNINLSGFSYEGAGISLETIEPAAGEVAGNVTVTNNGAIDAPDIEMGLDVVSAGTASVTNTGDITAMDEAIQVEAIGEITITNSGNITGGEYGGEGIQLASQTAGTIVNSGTIIAGDEGIEAWGPGNTTVTNESSGTIQSSIGIEIESGLNATVTNAGTIETDESGVTAVTYGGIYSETDENGNVETFTGSGGEVNVTNSGTISMVQPNSYDDSRYELNGHTLYTPSNVGILAVSMNGGARVRTEFDENGNPYEERLEFAPGADDAANNAVSVTNSGTIDGTGSDQSNGIYAMASDGVDINNSGDIMVANGAIYVTGNSPVTISNSGTIKVTGEYGPHAVTANSGHEFLGHLGQAVSVSNSGTIDLTGAGHYRRAIRASSNGGSVTITNSGSVITTADGARGLHALSGSDGYCNFGETDTCNRPPVQAGGTVTINSSGSVSTAGTDAPAIRGNSAGGAVNIDTSGSVTTVGDHSGAIRGASGSTGSNMMTIPTAGGTVTINNAAKVQTAGMFSHGIRGFSNGGIVDVTNEGAITITGNDSHGVSLQSGNNWIGDDSEASEGGSVTLTNNVGGNVSTGGMLSHALNASSSTGEVTIDNHANLSTTGIDARGIFGTSGSNRENDNQIPFVGGNIAITNSGTVTTQGFDSHAIEGWSNGGMVTVSNSGTVTTAGDDSFGLGIFSGTNRTENDRVVTKGGNVTGTNSGSVSTTGNFSRAIELWTYGGDIQADFTASSNVSTTGDDSHGLSAYTGNTRTEGGRVPLAGGDITANLAGSISTEGRDSWALDIATPGGDITFMSKATLSTGGENARAINLSSGDERSADGHVPAAGGTITATNLGNLSTLGTNSDGFKAYSHGGIVNGTNAGKISTVGIHSRGINLRSGNDWIENGDQPKAGGNVTLTNNVGGDISTSGDSSNAMQATSTTGNVVVSNAAVISTIGDESFGVAGFGGSNRDNDNQVVFVGGSVSVANSGSITTKGLDSNGMEGWSNGGAVTATNTGTISTAGVDSVGMAAYSGTNRTLNTRVVQTGSSVTLSNSGSVSTSGNSSTGVEAFSYGGAVQVDLASSSVISTTGDESTGLGAYSGDSRTDGERVPGFGGTVIANLDGTISTSGIDSDAVNVGSFGGDVIVTNNAVVTTSGSNSDGLGVGSGSFSGTDRTAGNGGTVTINNSSSVTVSGADSNAIVVLSPNGTIVINNTGSVSAANGKSILASGASTTTIANSGSLQNGATLDNGIDTLNNTGTLIGNFDFSGGNDTLNLNTGSAHSNATFDGGAGTDTANLNNSGELTGTFSNFETGNLAGGSSTLSSSWGSFGTFNILSGSQLTLNNGVLASDQVNLLAGSTLNGSGTISGNTTNNGSILLGSSDTLNVTGNLNSTAGSTIGLSVGGASGTNSSKIEVTGGQFTFASGDVLDVSVDANTDLSGESRYQVATADGGVDDLSTTNDAEAVEISDNSAAFSFERTIEGNSLWLTASSTISGVVSLLAPELSEEASVIEEFIVESGQGGELAEQLGDLSEEELVTAVKEITAPNEAAGAQAVSSSVSVANSIVNTRISGRVSSGRRGFNIGGRTSRSSFNADIGETEASRVVMAYGSEGITGSRWLDGNGYSQAWVQAFWGISDVGDADSNQYGTALGLDFRPDDSILLGGMFSYSRSDSDAPNSRLEADTYGGMLYGAKGFGTGLSLSGSVGYFHAENETRRAAFRSVYRGDYDTKTFMASGSIAQEIEMASSWLFTPNAGVRYARASFDTYTETNGPAPQTISRDDLSSVELSAQASFSRNFNVTATQQGLFEIHAGALYEVGDSNSTVSYRFSPTGSALTSQAGVPRLKFNVGTAVDVALTDRISTEFAYEGTFASDYADHMLRAKFKMKF